MFLAQSGHGWVRVSVRVGGANLFPHTHACKVGLSGMRFSEGGQRPGRERASRKASSAHATCHKTQAAQFQAYTTPAHVGFPIPPCDVCVAP